MRKVLIIINPAAGKGQSKNYIATIKARFESANIDYQIKISNRVGNVTELAKNGVKDGFNEIVAVGGDGTVIEVLNGIVGTDTKLGIIPAGTGNDFVRSIGIERDFIVALNVVIDGKYNLIDVGEVNNRYFLNVVSFGIDSEVVKIMEKIKTVVTGSAAYYVASIKAISTYKAVKMSITIDGKEYNRRAYLVAIGNGKYFGGGMKITPDAKVNSGDFEICIINHISRIGLMRLLAKANTGNHVSEKGVEIFKGKEITIRAITDHLSVNADGNLIGPAPAKISIFKNKLKVVSPCIVSETNEK
ncbi:MAG: diacylglycerol kinase family protein [Acidaminobacteraceae bacterium]